MANDQVDLSDQAVTTGRGRLSRRAWLPIPLLLLVIVGLWAANLQTAYESRLAMVLLNLFFTFLASACIGFLTARGFLATGQPGLLMFGCGALVWGITSLVAAVVVNRLNGTIFIHNVGMLAAALCHLAGVRWHGRLRRRGPWLVVGYSVALVVAAGIIWVALAGWIPVFFVQGQGGTWPRQSVLVLAVVLFAWVAWQMIHKFWRRSGTYYYWYGLGLALVAVGLTGVTLLTFQAGALGWVNRLTQYLGSVYLFIAALTAARESRTGAFSLQAVDESLQNFWLPGEEQRRRQATSWWARYGLAVVALAAGWGLRLVLTAWAGPGLPTYVTFYPAVMAVALLASFGPGLLAVALTCFVAAHEFLEPVGQFYITAPVDRVGLALFACMGVFMSIVAELYRRNGEKAAAYDRQAALRESQKQNEFLAGLIRDSSQPMGVGYPDGRLGLVNKAFEELTGYSHAELQAMNWAEQLTPPEWRQIEGEKLAELQRTGQPVRYEKEYLRKDGTRVPIELLVHMATDAEGRPQYYYSFLTDIRERKRAEETLRESEQRFQALAAATFEGVAIAEGGKMTDVNEQLLKILGYRREELIGTEVLSLFLPEDRERIGDIIRAGGESTVEHQLVRKDGRRIVIEAHGRTAVYHNRKVRFTAIRDITEGKRAAQALAESEAKYRNLFQNMTEEVHFWQLVRDEQGRIKTWRLVDANPPTLKSWGRTSVEEIRGKTTDEIFGPGATEHYREAVEKITREGTPYVFEDYFPNLDKHFRFTSVSLGEYFITTGADITGIKKAQEVLQATLQRFYLMLSSMSAAVLLMNDEGRVEFANQALCADFGLTESPAQLAGLTSVELLAKISQAYRHPDQACARVREIVAGKLTIRGEEVPMRDGRTGLRDVVFLEVGGQSRGRLWVQQDITARKRAEEALYKQAQDALLLSEQEFHSLAESMPQMVWATRPDGWNIYFNHQWVDYTGMTLEESYGHGWNIPFHPDDKQRAWEAWQRATQHLERYSLECRLRRADGVYRWWLIRGAPMLKPNGEVHKWFGTCTDIEDIKRAEAAIRQANELLEQRVSERTAALRDSERREHERAEELAVLLEAVPMPLFISHDTECLHMTGNRMADEILRIPHGNELSKSAPDAIRPSHFRALKDGRELRLDELPAQRAARGEPVEDFEFTIAFDDGLVRQVLGYGTPLLDTAGHPRGSVAALVDITQRKRDEATLREREERLQLFIEHAPAALAMFDRQMRYVSVSQRWLSDYGLVGRELQGVSHYDIFPEIPARWREIHQRGLNGAVVREDEDPFVRADGSTQWLRWEVRPWHDAGGQVAGILIFSEDITERKRAEDAVRRSETLLRAITDTTQDPIFLKDRDSRLLLANPATLAALHRSAEQVIGKTDEEFYDDPAVGRQVMANDRRVLASGQTETMEEIVPGPEGPRTFLSAKTPYRDADGQIIGVIGIARDITERKRAEEVIRLSEERYRTLFNSMLEGFCIIEMIFDADNHPIDYRFLEVNPTFEAQTGMKDAAGKRMREFAPNHEEHWFELYGKIALTGEPMRFVNQARELNRYYDVSAYRVGGPESRKVAILFSDISDATRAEAALRESEERFRTMANSMLQLAWIARPDGFIHWYNDRWYEYTGTTPKDMEGWGWQSVHDPQMLPKVLEQWKASIASGEPFEMTFPLRGADGKFRSFLTRGQPLKDAQGQVVQWFGTNTDVDALKQMEEALRASEERFRTVFETMTEGLSLNEIILDESGKPCDLRYLMVNPGFERHTGLNGPDLVGRTALELFPDVEPMWFERYGNVVMTGEPAHFEGPFGALDKWFEVSAFKTGPRQFAVIFMDVTARKRADEQIRLHAAVLEAAANGIVITAPDGTIQWVNPAFTELTGYTFAEAIGQNPRVLNSHTHDQAFFKNMWDTVLAGQVWHGELVNRRKDGSLYTEEMTITPVKTAAGKVEHFIAIKQDATARKAAEVALRQSQQLLKLITDAAPALISYIGADGRYRMANAAYHQWLGVDPEKMPGRLAHEVVGAAAWQKVQAYVDRVMAGETVLYEMELSYADTTPRWFHTSYTPDRDETGQVRGFVVLAMDITQRKHAEQAQLLLAAIVESTDDAIISKSLDGIILSWNAAAQRLLGYTAAEIIGRPITVLLPPEHLEEEEQIQALLRRGDRWEHLETVRVAKDGRRIDVSITASPLKDSQGHVVGASKIMRDITQRKQAEQALARTAEELARSNKDLAQFAYVASHDLQEPLRMVTGYMQLIEKRYKAKLEPEAVEFLAFAVDGATRMSRLITDLLDYSRVNTRGRPLEPVDMQEVMERALRNLEAAIAESGAVITHDPLPTVPGDASQLTQLLQNLIGNAIKFRATDRPPRICIGAEKKDDDWVFSVKDNGIGIEAQYAEKIFMIFQRLHSRAEYPGTGIGLAICKRIVERHGGRIWVQSEPGKGATFFFTIGNSGTIR